MKKFRIIIFALVFTMLLGVFTSCNKGSDDKTTTLEDQSQTQDAKEVNISVLKGPTGMGAARLMSQNEDKASKGKYNFNLESAADVVTSDLLAGKTDIAAIPTTAAATLFNKTNGKIRILAVSTLSVLYIIEKGNTLTDIASLKGKTIVSAGKGTNVEYVMTYILEQNGLKVGEDVTLDFVSEHAETVTQAKAGNANIVLLPEPFVTQLMLADEGYRKAFDFKDEWAKVSDFSLPMGVIATTKDFSENNADALANLFEDYKESVDFINDEAKNADAAALIGKYEVMPEAVAKLAIPSSNIAFITGDEMKEIVSDFFEKMYEANPEVIGGALPSDDIYYNK